MNRTTLKGDGEGGAMGCSTDGMELDLAARVQQLLLPKSSPVCTWCCIGVRNRMASGLGGDYFDFIAMPDDCQSLFIGDVTGHGLHASVVMSLIYGFIHRAARGACDPLEMIRQINGFLVDFARRSETIDHYFSTSLFFGIIDPETLRMHYVNAGQVPPLVLRSGAVSELHTTAPPLGFFQEPEMEAASFSFVRGDRLLLYTDGLVEAANAAGEQFGGERLKGFLKGSADADYMELLELLFTRLREFGAPDPPMDDCTAIVIDMHGPLG